MGILQGDSNDILKYVVDSETFTAFQDVEGLDDTDEVVNCISIPLSTSNLL